MSIFRRRKSDSTATEPEVEGTTTSAAEPEADASPAPTAAAYDRSEGPHDVAEVDDRGGRLDLGALWIGAHDGMELRLEINQEEQAVTSAIAVLGDSAVQLQAFAAPRSGGLWAEIRDEIAQSIATQGGTAEVRRGALGEELMTRMPQAGPGGRTVFAPARFAGVDGPRWFLRAVFSGQAAISEEAAAPLVDIVRSVVVVRGEAPMAPREMLPLRLPDVDEAPAGADAEDGAPDLNPFERGPEITEVR